MDRISRYIKGRRSYMSYRIADNKHLINDLGIGGWLLVKLFAHFVPTGMIEDYFSPCSFTAHPEDQR